MLDRSLILDGITRAKRVAQPTFTIETADADDEGHFIEVLEMTRDLHGQGGYAPFDPDKAAKVVYEIMCEGMVWIAREAAPSDGPDGRPIGMLALTEEQFWYSADTYLQGIGFWVVPEHRSGRVGVALLKRARQEAQARRQLCLITITSPDRRPKATRATLESQLAGFVPLGYTLRLN